MLSGQEGATRRYAVLAWGQLWVGDESEERNDAWLGGLPIGWAGGLGRPLSGHPSEGRI